MEELLQKINEMFDSCIANSNEETQLQLRILRNNINTLISEHQGSEPVAPQEPTIEVTNPDNGKKNILIVDDSNIVRNYLEKVFVDDYNVKLAEDGKIAIDLFNDENVNFTNGISLILLDIMMPNIDGFGVLEHLKAKNINIPVIIISGDNTKETINRAFEYNVVDVIEKPFDAKKIKEKIARYID